MLDGALRARVTDGADFMSDLPIVEVGPVAHGGHCVARMDGQVVFVRHTLPGETVRIRITDRQKSFLRADAVEVLEASPDRVEPPCPWSGPGRCGGCDFQHVDPAAQRRLLGDVVREQLRRLAGLPWDGEVEGVGPELGWRTRVRWTVDADGRPGLRAHRSHDIVPVDHCPIAHPDLPPVHDRRWEAGSVETIVSSTGDRLTVVDGRPASPDDHVVERVHDHDFRVTGSGFWQVHPRAAETLVDAVLAGADLQPGEHVVDLYAGVGLFSAFLADAVGETGRVDVVEWDRGGVSDSRTNLAGLPQVAIRPGATERVAPGLEGPVDVVVLDPPRTGAKKALPAIVGLGARRIVYVACDPAALARDLASFAARGYQLVGLRAFDLFPMTHHVECVAILDRVGLDTTG